MKYMLIKYLPLLFVALCSTGSKAEQIMMAFSQDIPPYIFEKYNKGIEIDIIAAALAHKGHTLKPLYFPLGRIPQAFKNKFVDAAMGDMGIDLTDHGGFYAQPTIIYNNVFITRQDKNISIKAPEDLDKLTIVSFQGAEKRYPKWLSKANQEKRFFGISNQMTQARLLDFGRYDVILSDRYIFKYFVKQLRLVKDLKNDNFDEHAFVKVNPQDYRPVFRSDKIRDDFNLGLKKIKETGEFQQIYDNYLGP
jgi:polar amino acid transport system substrate-binding protein